MRIHCVSDLHVDFDVNSQWVDGLSSADYTDDVLIVAGDISDSLRSLERTLASLVAKFETVLFIPGNHELWVIRQRETDTSFAKFDQVNQVALEAGALTSFTTPEVSIVPLWGWYDYSFGALTPSLYQEWSDFQACRWPPGIDAGDVASRLDQLNDTEAPMHSAMLISFSHFVPRIDIMPGYIPEHQQRLYPVLGTVRLEHRIRQLGSQIHVYGHSHVNRTIAIDGVTYINNAFGYPHEATISAKELLCIHAC
jgi:Icc-related predicted phosphoesterase